MARGSATVRVRYAETDRMQVAYYSNYFVWFEVARCELLRSVGRTYRDLEAAGFMLPVIEAHCEYRQPARYDDELTILTRGKLMSPVRVRGSTDRGWRRDGPRPHRACVGGRRRQAGAAPHRRSKAVGAGVATWRKSMNYHDHDHDPIRRSQPSPMPPGRRWWRAGLPLLLAIAVIGCSTPRADIPAIGEVEADRLLFERGSAALDEGDWRRARQYFVEIRDNYPQSQFRAAARLGIGESYEQEGSTEAYVRALAEFQDFLSLYPTHPRAAFAQYKFAMVHFHQMRRAERDQSETLNAIREFENFLDRYPTDQEWTPEVRERLREARDRLSSHDFTVGHFYYRVKFYPGAVNRFRQILDSHPDYSKRDEVYFFLGQTLADARQLSEAIPYFARILEEFEASEYAEDARVRISELEAELDR